MKTRRESTLSSENICWLDLILGLFVFSLPYFLFFSLFFSYFLFDLSRGCLEDLRNVFQCLLGPQEVLEKFSVVVGGGWWCSDNTVSEVKSSLFLLDFFLDLTLT